jgi:hypothetical protein
MKPKAVKNKPGYALTELTMTFALAGIVILAMCSVLVDSQRGWNRTFKRVFSDVVTDAYVARKTFDSIVRKSSYTRAAVGDHSIGDDFIQVYYYDDHNTSTQLDRYARFYKSGSSLMVDYGRLDVNGNPTGEPRTVVLAMNVREACFSLAGASAQMTLRLDNGDQQLTVMTSAVRHNK